MNDQRKFTDQTPPATGDPQASLQALYLRLPLLACKGKCQEACGPIVMSELEWSNLVEAAGREPLAAADDRSVRCPLLGEDGRCTTYDARPLICRLWGVAKGMPCPHGCRPHRMLSRNEGRKIIRAVEKLSSGPLHSTFPELAEAFGALRRPDASPTEP